MSGESIENTSVFATCTFISYLVTSLAVLVVYIISYLCVFRKNRESKCWDPLQYGFKIWVVLSWPILADTIHLTDATIELLNYFLGDDMWHVHHHAGIDICVGITIITNMTIVNYFQLKIAGIAAI